MANIIKLKSGDSGDSPGANSLVRGEVAIRHVAGDHTASSSSKLYFGEAQGSGSVTLRQFGFGIAGDTGQHGIAIGENFTITGGNALTTVVSGDAVTIDHDDTSSQASSNNSGQTFIQDITLDTYGHVTGIGTATASGSSGLSNIVEDTSPQLGGNLDGQANTITTTGLITANGGIAGGSSADITLNTDKFTVDATQGNTAVDGTLGVGGTLTATGGITIPAGAPREFSIAGEAITDIKTSSDSASTSDDDLVTAGYVNAHAGGGSGDITGVDISVSTGLDISQSNTTSGDYSSTITLDLTELTLGDGLDASAQGLELDLSELADGTADIDSNDEVIYLDNGTEKRKAFSELKLSEFDGNAKASMADSKVFPLAYYSDDNTITDAMPSTHLNTGTDGGFFITNVGTHEPELNLYRMDTDTKNTNGIAAIKFGNAAHDTDYDGDQPNVVIQAYGGRSSTNHDANTSPVVFRFRTTTYSTTSTTDETRWEMRPVNGDDHGANRGLHSGSFGNFQAYEQAGRGGIASTIPTCGSRFIYAYAEDGGPIATGTTNNIDLTSSNMTDLRDGQTFEIFAEVTAQSVGTTTSVTVTADWVGAGTSTKTIATGTGNGSYFGYMRCVYVPGSDFGGGSSGWYGFFGAEGVNSGEVTFTG